MISEPPVLSDDERQAIQRRTLGVLFVSSIFSRAAMTIGFVVAALLMEEILGSSTWAGASTAAITVGTALSASALAAYMNRNGRRPGLTVGYAIAMVGGVVAVIGAAQLSLVPYLLGLTLIGVGQGGTNLARYAAADLAEPSGRSKAISYVVFASTVGRRRRSRTGRGGRRHRRELGLRRAGRPVRLRRRLLPPRRDRGLGRAPPRSGWW